MENSKCNLLLFVNLRIGTAKPYIVYQIQEKQGVAPAIMADVSWWDTVEDLLPETYSVKKKRRKIKDVYRNSQSKY